MIESKEHDINPSEIQKDDLTEQLRDVELVRYKLFVLFFFCSVLIILAITCICT